MHGKRSGSLLRFGLAAVLACGLVPAAAFATPEGKSTETPPHRGIGDPSGRRRDRRLGRPGRPSRAKSLSFPSRQPGCVRLRRRNS